MAACTIRHFVAGAIAAGLASCSGNEPSSQGMLIPPCHSVSRMQFFFFDEGSAAPRPSDATQVRNIIASGSLCLWWLLPQTYADNPDARLCVAGHTDATGSDSENRLISRRRAEGVAAALAEMGIPRDQMIVKAHGSDQPLVPMYVSPAEAQNRRVEIYNCTPPRERGAI
jgi:flagellar motor protein MotB